MNWNIVLYIGLAFYVLIFVLFIANEMNKRKLDIELFKQQQLTKSSDDGENDSDDNYIFERKLLKQQIEEVIQFSLLNYFDRKHLGPLNS